MFRGQTGDVELEMMLSHQISQALVTAGVNNDLKVVTILSVGMRCKWIL